MSQPLNHAHGHAHTHAHGHAPDASTKNILLAFVLNLSFAVFEILGGLFTGSTAILSDAVHDFGDSLSLGLSLLFQKFSVKAPTAKYTYGFKRLPVIGAIVNICVLLAGTVFVFLEALERFAAPRAVMAEGMLFMAAVGVLVNGISALRMRGAKKILDKTVVLHLMEDLLGWAAVFVVSIVMYFTEWYILDPILSLVICAVILKNLIANIRLTADIILGATLDRSLAEEIRERTRALSPDVLEIRDFNLWSLDGAENVLSMRVAVAPHSDCRSLLQEIKAMLECAGVRHSTVELVAQ